MGVAFEVLTGRVTNAGGTLTEVTANTGDSFAVRSFPFEAGAWLEGIWAQSVAAQVVRVRSPRFHDNVQGIRYRTIADTPRNFLSDWSKMRLFPQDELVFETSSGGADTTTAALAVYYNDLPGINARLTTWEQIEPTIESLLTVEVDVAAAATVGDWSAGTTLTNFTDLLKRNVDYAVLGYQSEENVAAVAIRGSDTGNLRVGGPGTTEAIETRDWFVSLTRRMGTPHIPIINAANKDNTLVFQAENAAGAQNDVQLSLAELRPGA